MRMISKDKKVLEDVLRHNDATRRTQEGEEDIQRQEEAWIKDEQIRKAQKEVEEQNKQAKMDTCMNKEKQVPEDQQDAKPQWNTQSNKNVSIQHDNIFKFRLIPCILCH